jgi:hypothetical protein
VLTHACRRDACDPGEEAARFIERKTHLIFFSRLGRSLQAGRLRSQFLAARFGEIE